MKWEAHCASYACLSITARRLWFRRPWESLIPRLPLQAINAVIALPTGQQEATYSISKHKGFSNHKSRGKRITSILWLIWQKKWKGSLCDRDHLKARRALWLLVFMLYRRFYTPMTDKMMGSCIKRWRHNASLLRASDSLMITQLRSWNSAGTLVKVLSST